MIDLDRFFIAAAIQRRLLDVPALAEAIEDWNQTGERQLTEVLVQRGLVQAKELDVFQSMVRRITDDNPDKAADSLRKWTEEAVKTAQATVDDPTIQAYLAGSLRGPGRIVEGRSFFRLVAPRRKLGIGFVWLAHDLMLNRPIALKELQPDRAQSLAMRQRFLREAQITGNLQHPGIVPVYRLEGQEDSADIYYTMRLVDGRTLEQLAAEFHEYRTGEESDKLALGQLINAFESTCQAISYAHSQGIVHRDLKPANVMLGKFGEAVVVDWGLAKRLHADADGDAELVDSGIILRAMSPEDSLLPPDGQALSPSQYMPPEQAAGRNAEVGVTSDVYTLGGILFYILTGSVPHRWPEGVGAKDFLRQIIDVDPPRVRELAPWAPAPLDAICAKAMARNPSDRYQTVAQLIDDVQRWNAGEAVSVYPESRSRQMIRWMQHNKGTVAVAGGLFVTLVFVVALTLGYESANARNRAAVKLEQLRDSSESIADNIRYILRVRAESAGYLSCAKGVEDLLLALRTPDAPGVSDFREQSIRSLGDFLDTRYTPHTFSILDGRQKKEILRLNNHQRTADGRPQFRIEPSPGLKQSEIDDILFHVERLQPRTVYTDPLRPVLKSGVLVEDQSPGSRNCSAIVDSTGKVIGAFVDESSVVSTLVKAAYSHRLEHGAISSFMADEKGRLLYYSTASDFSLPKPPGPDDLLTDIFPELAPLFDPKRPELPWMSVERSAPTGQIVFATKIDFEHRHPDRMIVHCSAVSHAQLLKGVDRRSAPVFWGVAVALVVGIAIASLRARLPARKGAKS